MCEEMKVQVCREGKQRCITKLEHMLFSSCIDAAWMALEASFSANMTKHVGRANKRAQCECTIWAACYCRRPVDLPVGDLMPMLLVQQLSKHIPSNGQNGRNSCR